MRAAAAVERTPHERTRLVDDDAAFRIGTIGAVRGGTEIVDHLVHPAGHEFENHAAATGGAAVRAALVSGAENVAGRIHEQPADGHVAVRAILRSAELVGQGLLPCTAREPVQQATAVRATRLGRSPEIAAGVLDEPRRVRRRLEIVEDGFGPGRTVEDELIDHAVAILAARGRRSVERRGAVPGLAGSLAGVGQPDPRYGAVAGAAGEVIDRRESPF